ncbi:glycosyltransferase family 4 protein [Bacillus thuringiensis]|uniref:glycosyltransferase family 4 protein n=1 Tax=Bacillus thuringiensis TaxID=1428 RepID=UPI000E4769BD|nr:glycosyltransferase family 4 protein [Bacillus thuringiensis]MDZ3952450.1 glycosyltransferase family 4 protein [Bacillus thuringiensis]RGP53830.1 glycosyltransferase family 1 protein [Bacillus thuringiensis]
MKILYVITRANWGGAQAHLFELIKEAMHRGITCEVVVGEKGEFMDRVHKLGGVVHYIPELVHPIRPIQDMRAIYQLYKLIKEKAPTFVHAHSTKAGTVARIASFFARVPVIFTVHGWAFAEGVPKFRKRVAFIIERIMGYFPAKFICVSQYDKNIALENKVVRAEKVVTIPNGVMDLASDERKQGGINDKFTIIMVARFAMPKDQDTVLKALAMLEIDDRMQTEVIFIGDGDMWEHSRRLAKKLEIEDRVTFLGKCNMQEVQKCLQQSDVFVLISNHEGLPLSVIEAMSCGLPIIATDVGGMRELVRDRENGYLIKKGDCFQLKTYIQGLKRNPKLVQDFGNESRKVFECEFTIQHFLESTFRFYDANFIGKQ